MAKQAEIPGTERKDVSKKLRKLGEQHAEAINEHTKAGVKKRDTKLAVIAQMKEEGVEHYRDTETTPPIDVKYSLEDKLTVKKYRPPEADDEDDAPKKGRAKKGDGDLN